MAAVVNPTSTDALRETISYFVSSVTGGKTIDQDALTLPKVDTLHAAVLEKLSQSGLSNKLDLINSKNHLKLSCYVAADFVPLHPLEYQVMVAQLTIFFFHADDMLEQKPDILRRLQMNLLTGEPSGDCVLDWFIRELVPQLWDHFDPLIANMIVVACYDFLNGIGIEILLGQNTVNHKEAPGFPAWMRFKTGLSPMYALLVLVRTTDRKLPTGGLEKFVQALPDVIRFCNICNDVISFYKEALAGETSGYVHMCAQRDGVEPEVALRMVADEGLESVSRVMSVLTDEPEYRANFEVFTRGMSHFHTACPRYRLAELYKAC